MEYMRNTNCVFKVASLMLLLFAGFSKANVVMTDALPPPKNVNIALFPFGKTHTPTSVIIEWDKVPNANNYIVVIFKTQHDEVILHEEVKNVPETSVEFTGLDPSTTYEVVVNSVRVHLNGTSEQSKEATRFQFKTRNACTGSMIFVECKAHCVPTCTNQSPPCDRRCISGCSCPSETPFLHDGRCISKADCKKSGAPPTEVLSRPTGLKFHRIKGTRDLLFTWNKVEGADYYRVIVTLLDGTEVQRHDNIQVAVLIIGGLKPKTRYRFKVHAVFIKFAASSRTLSLGVLPMAPPEISQITNTSFFAKWTEYPLAIGFKMVIYNGVSGEILQIFRDLSKNYVTVQGLSPGNTYDVTVIVTTTASSEVESGKTPVTTLGQQGQKVSNPFLDDSDEIIHIIEETTTTTAKPPTTAPLIPTCQEVKQSLEAFLEFDSSIHIPDCDSDGDYAATQCVSSGCYCVEKQAGRKIDGSDFRSRKSTYALACDKYGQFNISPLALRTVAINTTSIRVRWVRLPGAAFYIAKVFDGFQGTFVKAISGLQKPVVVIDGLQRGTPYVVVVVAVNSEGWTSSDTVKGQFIATPYLDPPTNVRLEQFSADRMKVSWTKDELALNHDVVIYENGKTSPMTHENVTADHVIFQVYGSHPYRVQVKSNGISTIPGTGDTVVVSSNTVTVSRSPTCLFPALDVIFVIDITNTMTPEEYATVKTFYQKLVMGLTPIALSPNDVSGTRIAAVKTYGVSRNMFDFDRFTHPSNAWGAINFVRRTNAANYNLQRMVDHVYSSFFALGRRNGPRRDVHTAVISFVGDVGITRNPTFPQQTRRLQSVTNLITIAVNDVPLVNQNRIEIPSYQDTNIAYDLVMRILCNLK